ncbi:MAG: hypothetical protein K6F23_10560 [Solobacterium sp.]|nr:hypothetical protein [Solobacterium sp.]
MKLETLLNFRAELRRVEQLEFTLFSLYDTRHSVSQVTTSHKNGRTSDPVVDAFYKIEIVSMELEKAIEDWLNDAEEIENWLPERVPDPEVQAIIRFHFLLGENWKNTNKKVYGCFDYNYSRQRFYRYMEVNQILETSEKDL